MLIVLGSATGDQAMEDLINYTGIKTIAIGGRPNRHSQRQWAQIERNTGAGVVEISQEGGFLVDRLEK